MLSSELVSRRRRTRLSVVVLTIGSLFTLATCKLNDLISPKTDSLSLPTISLGADSSVIVGASLKLTATVAAGGATVAGTQYAVAWSVDNPTIASIASDGTITGIGIGSVNVTAKLQAPELGDNGPTVKKAITIVYKGIKISAVDSLRAINATRTLVVSGLNNAGVVVAAIPASQLSFTSRDTTVVKVDATGTVTARKSATTYVVASLGSLTDSFPVKVRQIAKTVNFGGATTLLVGSLGKARTVTFTALDSTGNAIPANVPTVSWSVNNTATAAIVAATGSLTALKADTTTVTVVVDGVAAKILMSVQQVPATITKTAGDARSDIVTQAVAVLPKVTVADSGGNAIAKDTVVFAVASGNGSISSGATQVTDANGTAAVGGWVLGPSASAQTLLVSSGSVSATFTVTGLPLAAKKLIFVTQPQTASVSTAIGSFQVAIADSLGNVVTTAGSTTVAMALGANPGSASLGGTVSASTTSGVATFASVNVSAGGTGYTLVASGGSYSAATSNTFIVYGTKAKLAVTTQPQAGRKGQVLQAIQVSVEDANGNVVGNATDSVAVAIATATGASNAHLTGTTKVAAVAGVATFSTLVIDSVGQASSGNPYKLTATSGTLTSATTSSFDVKPVGAAAQVAFTVQPVSTTAGATLASISVAVQDSGGGLVATATNQITLGVQTGPGSLASGSTTSVSAVNGVATFTNIIISKAGTGYSLNAAATGLTGTVSSTFSITTAATGTKLAFIQQPLNSAVSAAISPAVTVGLEDAFGNVITTDTNSVTLTIATGSGTLSGGTATKPQSGAASFSAVNIASTGTFTLTASAAGHSSVTSPSFSVVATSGTAMKLAFTTQPPNTGTSGTALSTFQVAAQDYSGNTVSTAAGVVSLSVASGPTNASLNNVTSVNLSGGVASFTNVTVPIAGTYTLQAAATGLNPATSTSFVVAAGARSKVVFLAQPSASVAGTVVTPASTAVCTAVCVAVEDANNNILTSDNSDQITIGVSSGSLGGTLAAQTQNGIATFSNLRARGTGTSIVLNASASGLPVASSNTFAVSAAPEVGVAFKTQPTSIIATTTYATGSQIQVQLVDSLNNVITTATDSVKLSIATGPNGGTINGATTVAAVSGVATFPSVSFSTAGTYVLTASSGTLSTANSFSFSVTAGSANKLVFTAQPSGTIAAGTNMGFTVTVEDGSNNVVTGAAPTIFLSLGSNPGSTTLSGTTSVNPVSGVATFSGIQLTKVGTGYTVIATASGLTSATSAALTIAPTTASALVFTTQPQQVGYGIGQTVKVSIEDAYSNVVTTNSSTAVTLSLTPSSNTTLVGGSATTAASGVVTFSNVAVTPSGTYTLTASASGFSSINSNSFVVNSTGSVASNSPTVVTDVTQSWGGSVVVVGSTAYWTDQNSQTLYSALIYGGGATALKTGIGIAGPVSSDGAGNLYWPVNGNLSTSYITRYNVAGNNTAVVVTGTNPNNASPGTFHVDADGTFLYFTASAGSGYNLYRIAASSTGATLSAATQLTMSNSVTSFTYTNSGGTPRIYLYDGAIKQITNPSTATSSSATTIVSSFPSGTTPSGLSRFAVSSVAGGGMLYWTTIGSGVFNTPGSLVSVSTTPGSTPSVVATVSNVTTIVDDGTSSVNGVNLYLTQTSGFSQSSGTGTTSLLRYNTNTGVLTTIGGNPAGAGIFVNGSDVYWMDANGILKAAK